MKGCFLLICALQILQKIDVTSESVNVKLEIYHPPENQDGSVLVLRATIVGDNKYELEVTSGYSGLHQLPIISKNVCEYPNEDHSPMYKEEHKSGIRKGIGNFVHRKFKSRLRSHDNDGYKLIPKSSTITLLFSIDIIEAILDYNVGNEMILTFAWKESEQPTLYADTLGTGKQSRWIKRERYLLPPYLYASPLEKEEAIRRLGPIHLQTTYTMNEVVHSMSGLQNVYFDFSKVTSEIPQDLYGMMITHLEMLMVSDTSFNCDHKSLNRMPSIKFKDANRQEYEFTRQEYTVKIPAKEGEAGTSEEKCFMAIIPSPTPDTWVLGATFARRYTLEIMNADDAARKTRMYGFNPHKPVHLGF
ncbi:unnamed protein product [Albugo candida]|uniref:Peptidase A1 domain-containing protein n=1 Tax=Albugo candida TaxID=65357 RepID=A0A024FTB3_9STRA|nr:unnamed protein product [Albugo candida]|eukprot:CCI10246.1 unnamed protein product [Albugo candida]